MSTSIDLSIIIVNYNNLHLLRSCLESLAHSVFEDAQTQLSYEVIIVNNNSEGDFQGVIDEFSLPIRIITNTENKGYAYANNQAFEIARGTYYLLLNNDVILFPHTILTLYEYLRDHPAVTVAGPRLLNRDMITQRTAHSFPDLLHIFFEVINLKYLVSKLNFVLKHLSFTKTFSSFQSYDEVREVECLHAACMMINTEHLDDTNHLFDDRYFIYFEDTDFFYHLHKTNRRVVYIPSTTAIHYHEQTTLVAPFLMYESKVKSALSFYQKNYSSLHLKALKVTLFVGLVLSYFFHLFSSYRRSEFLKRRVQLLQEVIHF
jgi:GT2 family glycosyltransferase